jgi:hypothetical protein
MAAQDHQLSFKVYKKMISVMIEALENISKYSEQISCTEPGPGFCPSLEISVNDSEIEMKTTNPVKKKEVNPLKDKIDKVNSQDSAALRELYRSIITNGEFSSKGGAGLGFIEMAKTTGSKLEYAFESLSKEYSLYTFRVSMHI